METITLHNIEGIVRKSGVDSDGNTWLQFKVDEFADQEPGVCMICEATLYDGWTCLDGGDEVCASHVRYADDLV